MVTHIGRVMRAVLAGFHQQQRPQRFRTLGQAPLGVLHQLRNLRQQTVDEQGPKRKFQHQDQRQQQRAVTSTSSGWWRSAVLASTSTSE